MSFLSRRVVAVVIFGALVTQGTAFAKNENAGNGNHGGTSTTVADNGHSNRGEGNNRNGVGNTGPGNQGNDKPVGNAGGNNGDHGNHGDGNNGNGVGNTGTGNQGNDKPVGNAGGNDDDNSNPGSGDSGNPGSGDPGTGNEGSGDQGSGGQDSGSGTQSSPSNQGKFQVKFVPLIFADVDSITRIYNQAGTENSLFKNIKELGPIDILELDDFSQGLKIVKQLDYNIGLGVAGLLTHTSLAGIGASVGIAPYGGAKVVFTNYVSELSELKEIKRRIPYTASEASELKIGESVLLEEKGGLFIGAGISAYGLGVGGKVIIEGNFKTYVERLTEDKVLAAVFTDKVRGASLYTTAGILALSQNKIKQMSEGFNYIIDLTDEDGRAAYEALMKGELSLAEQIADFSPLQAVKRTETLQRKLVGNSRRLTLGIPFISLSTGQGLFLEHSYRVNHVEGLYTDMSYGIFQKSTSSRLITRHNSTAQVFVGGTAETKKQNGNLVSKLSEGKFTWKYDDDHGTSGKFNKYLRKLKARTGLEELLSVLIADKEKLGYTEINFSVTYPDLYVRFLLSQASSEKLSNDIHIRAHELMVWYFKDQVDEDRICSWNVGDARLSDVGTKICVKTFAKQIAKKTAKLSRLLVSAREKQKNAAEFAKSMAQVGELIWSDPFLFHTLVEKGRACGVTAELNITGKRITYLKRELTARPNASCVVK